MAMSFAGRVAAIGLISAAGIVPILFSSLAHATPKAITDEVTLYSGQAMVRNAPGPIERIAVGDGKVLAVKIVGTQELVMIGEKAGDTSMQLWLSDGSQRSISVHVTATDSEQLSEAVRQMLGGNPNLTVTPINGNVV